MSREITFDVDEAIRLFAITPSWRKVAKQLGVHPYSVQSKLSSLGYVAVKAPYAKQWSDEASKLRGRGWGYQKISKKVGVSVTSIHREMIKKYGKGGRPDEGKGVD